ncbi:MAG: hypothetical protein AAF266_05525 [Planctomycetota bacterium]
MSSSRFNAALLLALGLGTMGHAQTDVFWIGGPAPEGWNDNTNWALEAGAGNFIPQADGTFNDQVIIGNGATATLTSAASFDVGEVQLGGLTIDTGTDYDTGTLDISGSGSLSVINNGVTSGDVIVGRVPNGGAALGTTIDDAQQGFLNISGNGSLSVANRFFVERRNNADPLVTLRDNASVTVSGDSDLRGTVRVAGPSVNFTTDTLQWGGQLRLVPEITQVGGGASHSPIQVTQAATLNAGAVIAPEFTSAPIGGEVYTLVDAASIANNGISLDTSATSLAPGQRLSLSVDRSGPTDLLNLSVDRVLTLIANRETGALTLENFNPTGITINGYSVGSPSASLDPSNSAWSSFADTGVNGGTWEEANPTNNALSELNLTSSRTFGGSSTVSLGAAYQTNTSRFGARSADDLTFTYQTTSGETVTGNIEYEGRQNTLVLRVDPTTGNAIVENDSLFPVEINGYSVGSGTGAGLGSLLTNWDSLDDQNVTGWEEANPSTEALSELNLADGLALAPGATFALDGLWDPSGNRDLDFSFSIRGASSAGDFNDDGVVDAADYTLWRDNEGGDAAVLNGNGSGTATVGAADLQVWRDNYGALALTGAVPGVVVYEAIALATAVPEPTSAALVVLLCGRLMATKPRRPIA